MRGRGKNIRFTQADIEKYSELLTPLQAKIMAMTLQHQHSYGDIAVELDMNIGTIKSNRARGAAIIQQAKNANAKQETNNRISA